VWSAFQVSRLSLRFSCYKDSSAYVTALYQLRHFNRQSACEFRSPPCTIKIVNLIIAVLICCSLRVTINIHINCVFTIRFISQHGPFSALLKYWSHLQRFVMPWAATAEQLLPNFSQTENKVAVYGNMKPYENVLWLLLLFFHWSYYNKYKIWWDSTPLNVKLIAVS